MNSIILKELLTNASRHKGEPTTAAIKIIVDYVDKVELQKEFMDASANRWKDVYEVALDRIKELESLLRIERKKYNE